MRNLRRSTVPGMTKWTYYRTDIAYICHSNNSAQLETGGWRTKSTKKALNLILAPYGLNVVQNKGQWYLYQNGALYGVFTDGMSIKLPVSNEYAA